MRKSTCLCLAAFAGSLTLGAFPLEWNVGNKTGVPYEVEISRAKLEKLAGVSKDCGFKVTAKTPEGDKELSVTLLEGQTSGSAALRFTVPEGTISLDCEPTESGEITSADKLNLFDGVLANASAWKANRGGKITVVDGKIQQAVDTHTINNTEINSFGCSALLFGDLIYRDSKGFGCGLGMNIYIVVKVVNEVLVSG